MPAWSESEKCEIDNTNWATRNNNSYLLPPSMYIIFSSSSAVLCIRTGGNEETLLLNIFPIFIQDFFSMMVKKNSHSKSLN